MNSKPFVQWAGGKRQLVSILESNLPDTFGTYYEPFLGGGALFFHIINRIKNAKLSDLNYDLMLTYSIIRDHVDDLIYSLCQHEKKYKVDYANYYYSVRQLNPKSNIEKASRLLFLNRTCYNGLYRVNKSGKFNVPHGKHKNRNIVNEENLRSVSKILQSKNISIKCQDFGAILSEIKKGDFVYFDPPYLPVSNTANFTSYTSQGFGIDELYRLAKLCNTLTDMGCKVLLSNSDTIHTKALFEKTPWKISKIQARRSINSDPKKRTGHHEFLIKNY